MAKVTWLGEDAAHAPAPGPSFCEWFNIRFPKDKAVDVDNPELIRLAKVNHFFKVEENAQTPESKSEEKKEYNWREAEKGIGYIPVKKKVRKPKPKPEEAKPEPGGE